MMMKLFSTFFAVTAIIVVGTLLTSVSMAQEIATQVIDLYPGWNLISIQVGGNISPSSFSAALDNPATTTSNESERLIEVWAYHPSGNPSIPGAWQTYQPKVVGFPSDLTTLQPGRGYWVNVSQFVQAKLTGLRWDGAVSLQTGWNLVGFPGLSLAQDEAQDLASVFGVNLARVPQVWTFDTSLQRFSGHDITAVPQLKELNLIKPGSAYWIYALEPLAIVPQPYVALPGDADASPLEVEVAFSATDFPTLPNPSQYVGTQIRKVRNSSEDVPFDLNANGIIDGPFTQDVLKFDIGVDRKVVTIGNNGAGLVNWVVTNSVPWLFTAAPDAKAYPANTNRPKTASGVVSADRDALTLYADTTGLLPGIQTGTITLYVGTIVKTVTVKLDVPASGGDWKGYATTQRVNGRNIGIGAVDMGINLFMEEGSSTRFRAVLNKDTSLLFPRDVFMNGVFYSGNQFSLTTNFQMDTGDRNAPPYDTFQKPANYDSLTGAAKARADFDANNDRKLDPANPFPFPVRREITLLGSRKTPDRMEGSYVESITGMLPNNQPIFIEGTFYLDRQTFEPTKRSIFNQTTTNNPIVIGSTSGTLFRETSINVTNAVSIQGVTVSLNVSFPSPTLLTITLYGPNGQQIVLHKNGGSIPSTFTLSDFNGLLGTGTWKVRVAWSATGERGYFNSWGLNIQGLATYSVMGKVAGNLGAGNVPLSGAHIVLSGSNLIEQTDTDANGQFIIPNLTENNYTLSISRPGFETRLISFFLNNANFYVGEGGASTSATMLNTPAILTPVSVSSPELRAGPPYGSAPLFVNFTALVPIADLNAIGTIQSATWTFGDGTAPITDTASATDDIAQTTAKHLYTTPGDYTASLLLTGASGTRTMNTAIHVQRMAPDTSGDAPTHQVVAAGFVGAFASPLSDAGAVIQLAQTGTTAQILQVKQANGSYVDLALASVSKGVVQQETKRDIGALDIDRPPLIATTNGSDFHLNDEDTDFGDSSKLIIVSGDGSVTLPFLVRSYQSLSPAEQSEFTNDLSLGVFAAYSPPTVGGVPNPERYRLFLTLGGAVFNPEPAKVSDLILQTGRVEP
ncbi:MAG: carboxypeptidase regulatory-like domain-containing protein [Verrucomicrobiaceae bacterium]|nr:carboxypeptidase regulatory-like domain-containing protein [Verrucomicrobiaceae bacterium]